MYKKWSENEIEHTVELLKVGKSFKEIGQVLGRSKDSVKRKMNGLGHYYFNYNATTRTISCLNCGNVIKVRKSSGQTFCGHSCSASYNNRLRSTPITKKCINCNSLLSNTQKKYCCFSCQHEYKKNMVFEKIENGDATLNSLWYKKFLIEKYGEECMECGWCEVNIYSGKIPIELEHIDGNSENNSLDNLKILCPNCHSLTSTYKALNSGNGRHTRRQRYKEGKSY